MRLYGLNAFGVVVASAAFFLVGFLWYGVVFADAWMAAEGVSAAEAEAQSPAWMAGGVVITVLQVVGIGLVLKWRRAHSVGAAMATAFALWLLFALLVVPVRPQLEQLLRGTTSPGALAEVDIDRARELLGDDAARSLERMAEVARLRGARIAVSIKPVITFAGFDAAGEIARIMHPTRGSISMRGAIAPIAQRRVPVDPNRDAGPDSEDGNPTETEVEHTR